ncbi:MAG: methyltransferase, partial [Candidatus Paceibacterota bacterium]
APPPPPPPLRILDLCAGSGAIGVAIAKAVPEARVTLAEIDRAHLPTIQKNIESNVSQGSIRMDRFKVVGSDLFEKVEGEFDFILTNPPYIDSAIDRTDESVKNHEPHLALYGGAHGMEIIDRIIATAPDYLIEGGQVWIEHEPEQVEAIRESAE